MTHANEQTTAADAGPVERPVRHLCECGKGVRVWNLRGEESCTHTLRLYEAQHGSLPLSGGPWSEFCQYPECRCPADAPEDPAWCFKGLAQAPRVVTIGE